MADNFLVFKSLVFLFIIIPIIELFTKADKSNLTTEGETIAKSAPFYDILIYLFVPFQFILLFYFLYDINSVTKTYLLVGKTVSMGLACGVIGINVAHELGHRSTWYEKLMSKALLMTSLYMHFFIEHNFGHHQNVSTDHDPASAKRGESLYAFHLRSIFSGYISAWKIQSEMLNRKGKFFFSIDNEMILFCVIQLVFLISIFFLFGTKSLLAFIAAALIGIFLLETVNYIEHYGLRRKRKENGDYERTMPVHSWNSNHPIGRIFLFELSRHSDHHFISSRKYQILRHFEDSPQMPTGYPGMMLLSTVPPLWFFFIHKRLDAYKSQNSVSELA
ncbi:MAG: alkane 1-monooxygenase [Chitinophagales bacterium]|jgi:alkane 1-monooxygenase|nr:alkane 1-monooxygenase [Sphingobacteriales bacterium]